MRKWNDKILITIIFLCGLLFFSGCDKLFNKDPGFLLGKISIGPLCPVETVPPDPGCLPTQETYKAYPVYIMTSNGRREIAQITPALDGSYKTELVTGHYLIILGTEFTRPGSSNLPAEVEINPQDTTILNIDIDTGIR